MWTWTVYRGVYRVRSPITKQNWRLMISVVLLIIWRNIMLWASFHCLSLIIWKDCRRSRSMFSVKLINALDVNVKQPRCIIQFTYCQCCQVRQACRCSWRKIGHDSKAYLVLWATRLHKIPAMRRSRVHWANLLLVRCPASMPEVLLLRMSTDSCCSK